jgi:hypothetical protein
MDFWSARMFAMDTKLAAQGPEVAGSNTHESARAYDWPSDQAAFEPGGLGSNSPRVASGYASSCARAQVWGRWIHREQTGARRQLDALDDLPS